MTSHFGQAGRNGLIASVFCFFLQGGWAIYANYGFGLTRSLLSGVVQGATSFGMTFVVTFLMETLLSFFAANSPLLRFLKTVLLTITGMILLLIAIHALAGTPNILLTILLPVGMGSIYVIVYSLGRIFLKKGGKMLPATASEQ